MDGTRLALLVLLVCVAIPANAGAGEPTTVHVEVTDTLAASTTEVRAVLLDLEAFDRWFPALAEWKVLSMTVEGARVYGRQALPWPIDDRDYVVEYTWSENAGGDFILDAVAQPNASPAPSASVIRLERMQSRWTVRAAGDQSTHVTYGYEADPGGALPSWIANLGWRARTSAVIDGLAAEVAARRHTR